MPFNATSACVTKHVCVCVCVSVCVCVRVREREREIGRKSKKESVDLGEAGVRSYFFTQASRRLTLTLTHTHTHSHTCARAHAPSPSLLRLRSEVRVWVVKETEEEGGRYRRLQRTTWIGTPPSLDLKLHFLFLYPDKHFDKKVRQVFRQISRQIFRQISPQIFWQTFCSSVLLCNEWEVGGELGGSWIKSSPIFLSTQINI